jgi:hypothetical protein
VCKAIIDTCVKKAIHFHDILHCFCLTRGTSTDIMEAKLQQEVASMLQAILFQVYLDLTEACDTLDQDHTLQMMKEYGVGSRLLWLIHNYWKSQQLTPASVDSMALLSRLNTEPPRVASFPAMSLTS